MSTELPLSGKTFLVLEDSLFSSVAIEDAVADAGGTIKLHTTIAGVHRSLSIGFRFDAAILDLRVLDGDASSLVKMLHAQGRPVVVASAYVSSLHRPPDEDGLVFLPKPYNDEQLVKSVAQAMATSRASGH